MYVNKLKIAKAVLQTANKNAQQPVKRSVQQTASLPLKANGNLVGRIRQFALQAGDITGGMINLHQIVLEDIALNVSQMMIENL